MKLYGYYRSSASYRVRIALNLKNLQYENEFIDLYRSGGEQFSPQYRMLNPQCLVPMMEDGGHLMTQSLAILEYLEETYPEPPLLPEQPVARARVRALAEQVACDIQPLANIRVLRRLGELDQDEEARLAWSRYWIAQGFAALEAGLAGARETGAYAYGETPTLADVCLVPQVYNAERVGLDMSAYPTLQAVADHCRAQPAFVAAAPENQPDAPAEEA